MIKCPLPIFFIWRTYDQLEIDLIEEVNTKLLAFEIKWGDKIAQCPKVFMEAYPEAVFQTFNRDNFYQYLI